MGKVIAVCISEKKGTQKHPRILEQNIMMCFMAASADTEK